MKIKLLFVNESLTLAGGEKSLIALLTKIDSKKYEVDLQLFKYGGELEQFIPSYVNLLTPLKYAKFSEKSWFKNLLSCVKPSNIKFLKSKLYYSISLRRSNFNNPEKAQLYWEAIGAVIDGNPKQYDVAIAYAQGIPTFYVMDKIKAKKKIAWVNVNVLFSERNTPFQKSYYSKYDAIVTVSEVTRAHLENIFSDFSDKLYTIYDMMDYKTIIKMAELEQFEINKNAFTILTVARLNKHQKGYDITLEACKLLKNKKINFRWYAIGKGVYKKEMELYIKEYGLQECFIFLGTKTNPYPYFKAADLYVQTSRHEGYGLSIAEARMLNTPVVTTKFDTVYMQMIDGKNGLVVDLNATAVADAIERMMHDKDLYNRIVEYLKQEEKENYTSVQRFDVLVKKLLD